jgi:hypothetical protein
MLGGTGKVRDNGSVKGEGVEDEAVRRSDTRTPATEVNEGSFRGSTWIADDNRMGSLVEM